MDLKFIVKPEELECIKTGQTNEYYLPLTDGNADLLCNFDRKGKMTGFKQFPSVTFTDGFNSENTVLCTVNEINADVFYDFIPTGMKKGDKAFTISFNINH